MCLTGTTKGGDGIDEETLKELIEAIYEDMKKEPERPGSERNTNMKNHILSNFTTFEFDYTVDDWQTLGALAWAGMFAGASLAVLLITIICAI